MPTELHVVVLFAGFYPLPVTFIEFIRPRLWTASRGLFPGSDVAETDTDECCFLVNIASDYVRDQASHSTMCYTTFIRVSGREERGSSLVRNMHAWGQDRASNNAISRIFEIFRVCFIHHEFGKKEPHFISNPVDIKCDSVKCLADDRFYLCGN